MWKHVSISPAEAADRLAIRELVEAYAHCADRRDAKGQMSLFTAEAFSRISFNADLAQAVADADLVIEAIPEVAKIKTDFYTQLGKVAPEKTIFATNSSTLLPSQFAEVTGRPDKFVALHVASALWKNNTVEIMKYPRTE